jgi:hypothetical protein
MAASGRPRALSKRCATGSRVRRRRCPIEPFLLCIIDYDNNRFTIEGPMTDAEGWIREVVAARRAGRDIVCQVVAGAPDDAAKALRTRMAALDGRLARSFSPGYHYAEHLCWWKHRPSAERASTAERDQRRAA